MTRFAICFAVLAGALVSTPAQAATFSTPIRVPDGASIDLVIDRSREEARTGRPVVKTGGLFKYRQTLTPLRDGYRVRQTMTGMDGVDPAAAGIEALISASDLTFEASGDLAPVRIEDWPETLDRLIAAVGKVDPTSPQVAESVRKMFLTMTPELAAGVLLKEQAMLSLPQGVELETGEPVSVEDRVPNPLGGPVIDATLTVTLESVDETAGKAVIRTRHTLDPASAKTSMRQAIERLMATAPQAAKPTPEELATLDIARTSACRYEMDLKSGLTAKANCEMTTDISAGSQGSSRRVDRWTITQTLVLK